MEKKLVYLPLLYGDHVRQTACYASAACKKTNKKIPSLHWILKLSFNFL